jgi:hypothetical protein
MDYYEVLASMAKPVEIVPAQTSYFSAPAGGLDPRLFQNDKFKADVRQSILSVLFGFLSQRYQDAESWCHVWLAGSGVSRQWAAHREPADLDCLVGINYQAFRQSNPNFTGFSDGDIASTLNEDFQVLGEQTDNFMGTYELTFYANVRADITAIKPYAAYSLTNDSWTVTPPETMPIHKKDWDIRSVNDMTRTLEIINRYQKALNDITAARYDYARINAERALQLAIQQGAALFDEIHGGRKQAFSPSGEGYLDYANYRWQAGKESGIVPALRSLQNLSKESQKEYAVRTYGVELPDASVLVRRAMRK